VVVCSPSRVTFDSDVVTTLASHEFVDAVEADQEMRTQ
jgi:hypothetical protein